MASTSTICKKGMDINIIVLPNSRRKGVGKSLSAFLINAILDKEIIPNWDAANKNSYYLALSLGYTPIGSYDAYHISKK